MNHSSRKPVGPRGGACTADVTGVDCSPRSTGVCQGGADARWFAPGMRTMTMKRFVARLAMVAFASAGRDGVLEHADGVERHHRHDR